jgi:phage-related protein
LRTTGDERTPRTNVVFYREDDGTVPLLEWLDTLSRKAKAKCRIRIDRLKELGYELRRPEADFLRNGIYELRMHLHGINYRMLYFFYGTTACVVSHGLVKEREVPHREINRALERKSKFEASPGRHSYME